MSKRSKYDSYFKRSGDKGICKECDAEIVWTRSSGTNALLHHLTQKHPKSVQEITEKDEEIKKKKIEQVSDTRKQTTIPYPVQEMKSVKIPQSAATQLNIWESEGEKTKKIERAITQMICLDIQPFQMVENIGFQNLIKILAPKFRIKSRTYFSGVGLPDLINEICAKVSNDLGSMEEISFTSDAWSSADNNHSILSLTGHWIHKETFEPKFAVIGCKSVDGKHTAENFQNIINRTLDQFSIKKEAVVTLTRDGAATMESLGNLLQIHHIHCYAHFLQLCVKEMMEDNDDVDVLILKMKKITRKLHRSGTCKATFSSILNKELLHERMLKKATDIRWSSLYLMIESFLLNKKAVILLTIDHPEYGFPSFTPEEWILMEELRKVLEPVSETTRSVQHRFYAPSSIIIPSLRLLLFKLEEMSSESSSALSSNLILNLRQAIHARCGKYIRDENLRTSTFLDPRYKDSFFNSSHKNTILRILREKTGNVDNEEKEEEVKSEIEKPIETMSLYDKFMKRNENPSLEEEPKNDLFEEEVKNYLKVPPSSTINPYQYWANNTEFPNLKLMARRFLSIPSSSSESERLFSISGLICSSKRSRLSNENVERLTFANLNLKLYGLD